MDRPSHSKTRISFTGTSAVEQTRTRATVGPFQGGGPPPSLQLHAAQLLDDGGLDLLGHALDGDVVEDGAEEAGDEELERAAAVQAAALEVEQRLAVHGPDRRPVAAAHDVGGEDLEHRV